jgi:hypothetical protein
MGIGIALLLAAPASAVPLVLDYFDNTAGHPDIAVAFDSVNGAPTSDTDLLQGASWATGNITPSEVLGNLLIVQENDDCTATFCNDPDDQAGVGGQITFDYSDLGTFDSFSFDLIDHQPGAGEGGSIQFLLEGSEVEFFSFNDFLGFAQGVLYGDNSTYRIDFTNEVGAGFEFDEVVIALRGSGAIDNLVASPVTIPEPNTMALGGLGLVMLATVGRRRNRR